MTYQAIFFDMDETLLFMNEKQFLQEYVQRMAMFFEEQIPGQGKAIAKIVGASTDVLKRGVAGETNEKRFWDFMEHHSSWTREDLEPLFLRFYEESFGKIEAEQQKDETMQAVVQTLVDKGYPLVVATNPMLPAPANRHRAQWCGVEGIPWLDITGFENYCWCKPNPEYFLEICNRFDFDPCRCLMVGNGMVEDMGALDAGMDFYLLLDQAKGGNPDDYTGLKGYKEDLLAFVNRLPMWEEK